MTRQNEHKLMPTSNVAQQRHDLQEALGEIDNLRRNYVALQRQRDEWERVASDALAGFDRVKQQRDDLQARVSSLEAEIIRKCVATMKEKQADGNP